MRTGDVLGTGHPRDNGGRLAPFRRGTVVVTRGNRPGTQHVGQLARRDAQRRRQTLALPRVRIH
ncbi:MAG: hypothetical protein ACRDRZ_17465 [Pseudonocardiaceae bacterium]